MAAETFWDRTRSAHRQARHIANGAQQRRTEAKTELKAACRRLVGITKANMRQARQVLESPKEEGSQSANRLADTLETVPQVGI